MGFLTKHYKLFLVVFLCISLPITAIHLFRKYTNGVNSNIVKNTSKNLGAKESNLLLQELDTSGEGNIFFPFNKFYIIYITDQTFDEIKRKVILEGFQIYTLGRGSNLERSPSSDTLSTLNRGQYSPQYSEFSIGDYYEKDLTGFLSKDAPSYQQHAPISTTWDKEVNNMTVYVEFAEMSNAGDKYKFKGNEVEGNLLIIQAIWKN